MSAPDPSMLGIEDIRLRMAMGGMNEEEMEYAEKPRPSLFNVIKKLKETNGPSFNRLVYLAKINEHEFKGDIEKERWQRDKMRGGLYVQKFDDPDGFIRIQSDYTDDVRSQPFKSTCWAAGFSFSKGEFVKEVSYDPYTPFLFFGEEMDIAVRAFTHGWDFFSPSKTVVFHNYKRDHRNTFWEKPEQKPLEILSRFRVYVRLGYLKKEAIPKEYNFILNEEEHWPIGKERTIEEWEKLCNVNIKEEKVLS